VNIIEGSCIDSVFANAVFSMQAPVNPRHLPTLEISPACFTLANPNKCVMVSKKINLQFLAMEPLWIIAGMDDISPLVRVMPKIADYLDGPRTFGAYGPRFDNQIRWVVSQIEDDRFTRRAVISYWRPEIASVSSLKTKDVPCTLTHQFLVRDGKLNMVVNMRSNDVWRGLPYDIFTFVTIQNLVLGVINARCNLALKLGSYTHVAGSLHLYTADYDPAKKASSEVRMVDAITSSDSSFECEPIEFDRVPDMAAISQKLKVLLMSISVDDRSTFRRAYDTSKIPDAIRRLINAAAIKVFPDSIDKEDLPGWYIERLT
jgi:Thymidylate synthase